MSRLSTIIEINEEDIVVIMNNESPIAIMNDRSSGPIVIKSYTREEVTIRDRMIRFTILIFITLAVAIPLSYFVSPLASPWCFAVSLIVWFQIDKQRNQMSDSITTYVESESHL